MYRIAIIAALEREVAPLVRGWEVKHDQVSPVYRTFAKDDVVVVCAGIGSRAAHNAAENAAKLYRPEWMFSAGLAGALVPDLHVGQVIVPSVVINSSTGEEFETGHGSGRLVSASGIAGPEAKLLFARQHSAQLVDMEAAAVFAVAAHHGISFSAAKAISDEVDFELPDLEPFVDPEGRFLTSKFAFHIALRPRLWKIALRLAENSSKAAAELCSVLHTLIQDARQQTSVRKETRS